MKVEIRIDPACHEPRLILETAEVTEELRALGGALFGERRYGRVFTFHNGADSYYGVRGWRGLVRV